MLAICISVCNMARARVFFSVGYLHMLYLYESRTEESSFCEGCLHLLNLKHDEDFVFVCSCWLFQCIVH